MAKASVRGALIKRPKVDRQIFFGTIFKEQYFLKDGRFKEQEAIEEKIHRQGYADQACDAVEIYLGSHKGTHVLTETERISELKKVKTAAKKLHLYLLEGNQKKIGEWNEKLVLCVNNLALSSKDALYKALLRNSLNFYELQKTMLDYPLCNYGVNEIEILNFIATIKLDSLDEALFVGYDQQHSPTWLDPYLPYLLITLAPVWKDITGRTVMPTNTSRADGAKWHPFADWVVTFVRDASAIEIKERTIHDVLKKIKI